MSLAAVSALPDGDVVRIFLVAPMILFVPGYLLLEAARSVRAPVRRRFSSAALAPGASLAFIAVLAFATVVLPGGFTPTGIVAFITLTCVGLTIAAGYRRYRIAVSRSQPPPPTPTRRPAQGAVVAGRPRPVPPPPLSTPPVRQPPMSAPPPRNPTSRPPVRNVQTGRN